ncbi:hypothetical protein GWI33_014627 [Rhynchophorus ferrugineus]|uniref:Uncharacterized protein n=1 Tax=Rhynchophorus ferrugineus TaxID=354439 RepID=A0A834I181_RHYFE|nr:hypothetical protein GWI33_014627 [Rhynchophorus ferrugineus]
MSHLSDTGADKSRAAANVACPARFPPEKDAPAREERRRRERRDADSLDRSSGPRFAGIRRCEAAMIDLGHLRSKSNRYSLLNS